MQVPADIVRALWDRQRGRVHRITFPDGSAEAIDLWGGPASGHVLRADGRIFEWDLEPSLAVTYRLADQRSAVRGIAIAAKRLPELRRSFPSRPEEGAVDCATCEGHGFLDIGDKPRFLVCDMCDGLGWCAA
jgi:hypothetical protein